MPRRRTQFVKNGIYHIVQRGNNKAFIFQNADDKLFFQNIIKNVKKKYPFLLLYYVLMDNHYHLLMEMEDVSISQVMQAINHKYSLYYNRKYERTGTIFGAPFKSYAVYGPRYFRKLILYIANNPVKANLAKSYDAYKWSAHSEIVASRSVLVSRKRLFFHLTEADKHGYAVYKHLMKEKLPTAQEVLNEKAVNRVFAIESNQKILEMLVHEFFSDHQMNVHHLFSEVCTPERTALRKACATFASKEGFSIKEIAIFLNVSTRAVLYMITDAKSAS